MEEEDLKTLKVKDVLRKNWSVLECVLELNKREV